MLVGTKQNNIEKVIEKVKLEFAEFKKKTNGVIHIENDDVVTKAFFYQEIAKFLANEKESHAVGLKTRISMEDYGILINDGAEIVESIIGEYYDSDIGTSYDDITQLINWVLETMKARIEEENVFYYEIHFWYDRKNGESLYFKSEKNLENEEDIIAEASQIFGNEYNYMKCDYAEKIDKETYFDMVGE